MQKMRALQSWRLRWRSDLLSARHLLYLFGTLHSMETERTINKVRMSRGVQYTRQMSEQRQFLALYNSKDQLQVTDSKWAEWQAKAAEHAAQRKASPAGGDFAAMLQAALQKAQSSSKGRTRRGVQGAEQQAKEAAQRREKDPAAKRVRLVKDMGYLSLKRAAMLGLLQQQQMGEQQQQQEGSSRNSKRSSLQLKFASSTLQR